jgi:hypothetical protein
MMGSELAGPRTDNQDDGIEAVSDRVLGQNLFHQLAQISDELRIGRSFRYNRGKGGVVLNFVANDSVAFVEL